MPSLRAGILFINNSQILLFICLGILMSTCQVRGQLTGAGSLLSLCRSPGLPQVIRLGSNCLYLLSHLTSLRLGFLMPRDLWISLVSKVVGEDRGLPVAEGAELIATLHPLPFKQAAWAHWSIAWGHELGTVWVPVIICSVSQL